MKIKTPSLELNWLKFPKDISIPDIIYIGEDDYEYSGCYYEPEKNEAWIGNTYYPLDRGLIVIREDGWTESTLCHEFRHHLQRTYYGYDWECSEFDFNIKYKDAIVKYFTNDPFELDAHLYEIKKYPDDENLEWHEWIVKHYENSNNRIKNVQ